MAGLKLAPGQAAGHHDVESHGHSDSDRREIASATGVCGGEHDDNEEKGEHGLDHESGCGRDRECRRAENDILCELGPAEAGGDAAKHCPQKERRAGSGDKLADNVSDRFAETHGAGGQDADGDRRVKMGARQIAVGEGKDHNRQAVREGNRRDPVEAGACPDHRRGPSADEHERESADELRKKLGGKMVLHFDLRAKTV
jgi:hypothetical protein